MASYVLNFIVIIMHIKWMCIFKTWIIDLKLLTKKKQWLRFDVYIINNKRWMYYTIKN